MGNQTFECDWVQILNITKDSAVLFRTDSSVVIGSGHVMRCLTLADELRESCGEIGFICRELPGNLIEYIERRGFRVFRLPLRRANVPWQADAEGTGEIILRNRLNPDWLVVDHYALDKQWESAMRPLAQRIMVIDDLVDRGHDCDLLLDQNYYRQQETRYAGLVPGTARQLLGPKYALLRREFKAARRDLRRRDGFIRRILIFYGGSDPTNETAKALKAVKRLNRPGIAVDVVVGVINPNRERIREICSGMINTNFYCQVENMAELMAEADLALGAGGAATWERCYLGLPSLVTIVAENQRETVEALAEDGVVCNLGWHRDVIVDQLVESIKALLEDPDSVREMTRRGLALFEG
ncbi:MAG: UDP-2,4-diacetamido-2,4,6-trideoxy-beta-L-altropyranose hydrolase [Firmicutes bacterium]|nr:UDP-2,4-diacetamido-2,4,6-trideoxy-beta-L-altropyranose hydrolase [Bacillota bacterium]